MPIFDYQCEACGHAFDVLQKVGEGPLRKCPECGKLKLKKQLAAPNFHLKGSGWYKTDFKDKSAKKAPEASGAKSTEKSEGKSEAKGDGEKKGHTLDSAPATEARPRAQPQPRRPYPQPWPRRPQALKPQLQ